MERFVLFAVLLSLRVCESVVFANRNKSIKYLMLGFYKLLNYIIKMEILCKVSFDLVKKKILMPSSIAYG